jgi:hypothetical protein
VVFILKKIKKIQIVINANKNTVNGLLKKLWICLGFKLSQ